MASIFDRYGLKEVSNVSIYDLKADGSLGDLVLYLDSLKVSTIEQTAESVDATGGWGNPKLISWDYGKEMTLTLEDALLSPESMRVMMGGSIRKASSADVVKVHVTSAIVKASDLTGGKEKKEVITKINDTYGHSWDMPAKYKAIDMTTGARYDEECIKGETEGISAPQDDDQIRIFFEAEMKGATGTDAYEITISPSTFPGTYYFVGDTLLRSETSGNDEPYQWILPKGKISSEITFTMEAEGDPATFEFNVNALRSLNKDTGKYEMMRFVKYNFDVAAEEGKEHATHGIEHIGEQVNG